MSSLYNLFVPRMQLAIPNFVSIPFFVSSRSRVGSAIPTARSLPWMKPLIWLMRHYYIPSYDTMLRTSNPNDLPPVYLHTLCAARGCPEAPAFRSWHAIPIWLLYLRIALCHWRKGGRLLRFLQKNILNNIGGMCVVRESMSFHRPVICIARSQTRIFVRSGASLPAWESNPSNENVRFPLWLTLFFRFDHHVVMASVFETTKYMISRRYN